MKLPIAARYAGLATIFAFATALIPGAVSAGSAGPVSVPVSATVTQNCTITAPVAIAFGAYDPVTVTTATNAAGSVTITCTKAATGVTLTLNDGSGVTATCGSDKRAMTGGTNANALCYDIYEDSSHTTRFPATAVSETVSGGITTPSVISLYGQIKAAAQDVSVDSYNDTVQATINW
ncbi:MAG TPA: spore coat protein U domain-containing protein [Candidatus Baltobacteraceae bacterium]|jgi:spore coat protein U-like protein